MAMKRAKDAVLIVLNEAIVLDKERKSLNLEFLKHVTVQRLETSGT